MSKHSLVDETICEKWLTKFVASMPLRKSKIWRTSCSRIGDMFGLELFYASEKKVKKYRNFSAEEKYCRKNIIHTCARVRSRHHHHDHDHDHDHHDHEHGMNTAWPPWPWSQLIITYGHSHHSGINSFVIETEQTFSSRKQRMVERELLLRTRISRYKGILNGRIRLPNHLQEFNGLFDISRRSRWNDKTQLNIGLLGRTFRKPITRKLLLLVLKNKSNGRPNRTTFFITVLFPGVFFFLVFGANLRSLLHGNFTKDAAWISDHQSVQVSFVTTEPTRWPYYRQSSPGFTVTLAPSHTLYCQS